MIKKSLKRKRKIKNIKKKLNFFNFLIKWYFWLMILIYTIVMSFRFSFIDSFLQSIYLFIFIFIIIATIKELIKYLIIKYK